METLSIRQAEWASLTDKDRQVVSMRLQIVKTLSSAKNKGQTVEGLLEEYRGVVGVSSTSIYRWCQNWKRLGREGLIDKAMLKRSGVRSQSSQLPELPLHKVSRLLRCTIMRLCLHTQRAKILTTLNPKNGSPRKSS